MVRSWAYICMLFLLGLNVANDFRAGICKTAIINKTLGSILLLHATPRSLLIARNSETKGRFFLCRAEKIVAPLGT